MYLVSWECVTGLFFSRVLDACCVCDEGTLEVASLLPDWEYKAVIGWACCGFSAIIKVSLFCFSTELKTKSKNYILSLVLDYQINAVLVTTEGLILLTELSISFSLILPGVRPDRYTSISPLWQNTSSGGREGQKISRIKWRDVANRPGHQKFDTLTTELACLPVEIISTL